jgi:hypothetical protein
VAREAGSPAPIVPTPLIGTPPTPFPLSAITESDFKYEPDVAYAIRRNQSNGWWSLMMLARELNGDDNSHRFHGWIVLNEDIAEFKYLSRFSPNENFIREPRRIHFDFRSPTNRRFLDTIQFRPATPTCITFTLWLDGRPAAGSVHFGRDLSAGRPAHLRFCP